MKIDAILSVILASGLAASTASAQLLFSENFDEDHSASWLTQTLGTGSDANFFFDYSTVGVPSAPNSGGTTLGLRLRANQNLGSAGTFPAGVSVSPIGQSFTGDYELRFDMWLNFNGPAPGGGSGSTQITGTGIGTAGTSAQIAGGVIDSINFGTSAEGGTTVDYRAYSPAAQSGLLPDSGVFAAGTHSTARNNTDPYYAGFGGESAPAAQLTLFSQQTGETGAGALGWAWRDVQVAKTGDLVTWKVDGLLLATVDTTTAGTLGGANILFNHYDINATVSTDPNAPSLLFGLIDNVTVTQIPEPSMAALALLGALTWFVAARRKR